MTMAIFDSEKRTRGLRVPSLTAMKNGVAVSKSQLSLHSLKKDNKTPEEEIVPAMPAAVPAPPPQRAPPPTKELPPPPKDQKPPPPKVLTKVPPRRAVGNAPSTAKSPVATQTPVTLPPTPSPTPPQTQTQTQAPPQSQPVPAASPAATSPQTQIHAPLPPLPPTPQPARPTEQSVTAPQPREEQPLPPVTISTPPAEDSDANTPLEDFIPTPEGPGSPVEPMTEEQSQFIPPEVKPVAAPLNKVHFACFQEHRNMPVAQNTWCPLPCQTCNKFDTEIRHRCVFCSLRVCESCYKALQKCKHRSLNELLEKLD